MGTVAAIGCSPVPWRPEGKLVELWGLEPADPELEDFGLVRLRGASGSEGGGGGEGVFWGGGERFSMLAVAADIWARCEVAEIQLGTW